MDFFDILVAILPVFAMVGVGCLTRLTGILNDDSEKSVLSLVLLVLYPCFILWKVPGNESLQDVTTVGVALVAGFLLTVIGFGVAWLVGFSLNVDDEQGRNTFCLSAGLQNYGFVPIPLIIALFGKSADETLGVVFIHNLGLEIALYTIGIIIVSGEMKGAFKRLINGPTVAITIGLFLNFSGLHEHIPATAKSAISQLGNCTIPVSLILVGAALTGVVQSEKWETKWRVIGGGLGVRFVLMPAVLLGAAWLLAFAPNLQRVLIVQSAMPAAIFPVVLAKHFGGKPGVAAQIIIATSIASLLMTPLLLSLALKFFAIEC